MFAPNVEPQQRLQSSQIYPRRTTASVPRELAVYQKLQHRIFPFQLPRTGERLSRMVESVPVLSTVECSGASNYALSLDFAFMRVPLSHNIAVKALANVRSIRGLVWKGI